MEARITPLLSLLHALTVGDFLRVMASPMQTVFVTWPSLFFSSPWARFKHPQVIFVQHLLDPLHVALLSVPVPNHSVASLDVAVDEIFHRDVKFPPLNLFSGLLSDHLTGFPSKVIIVTDASTRNEKAGVGSFSHSLDCAFSR